MNVEAVVEELKKIYPGKKIIENKNREGKITEIICEIEPGKDKSIAIAVVDKSVPHYHKTITEKYEIIRGQLIVNKAGKDYFLQNGDEMTIHPGEVHSAQGQGAWVRVTSTPGWSILDHIIKN
jgi:mannose-6-phosphate isomerase-like protein (cupin superfamily)